MIQTIAKYFRERKKKREDRKRNWLDYLRIAFDGICFPILIIELGNPRFVSAIEEYSYDPDLHFHKLHQESTLLDSAGLHREWSYDLKYEANIPSGPKKSISLGEFKSYIQINCPNIDPKIYSQESTFESIIRAIGDASYLYKLRWLPNQALKLTE